jgi:hypothetical protein
VLELVVCVCVDVDVELVWVEVVLALFGWVEVKSSLTFAPVNVTVWVIGPKPGPEAVTVMVPEVPIGIAYPPDEEVTA